MSHVNEAKVEVLKVWYSVFCVLVDGHAEGELSGQQFIDKCCRLRRELAERIPEVEREFAKKRQ